EAFKGIYHVSTIEDKPSDTIMKVLHMTLNQLQNEREIYPLGYELYNPIIHQMLNTVEVKGDKGEMKIGYYMNRAKATWDIDDRMNNVLGKKECIDYWKDMVMSRGKQVISSNEKLIIDTIVNNWK